MRIIALPRSRVFKTSSIPSYSLFLEIETMFAYILIHETCHVTSNWIPQSGLRFHLDPIHYGTRSSSPDLAAHKSYRKKLRKLKDHDLRKKSKKDLRPTNWNFKKKKNIWRSLKTHKEKKEDNLSHKRIIKKKKYKPILNMASQG